MTNFMYIAIDLETTGVQIGRNRIVSIAARLVQTGTGFCPVNWTPSVVPQHDHMSFYSLVNPEQPNFARDINHLSDETLRKCLTFNVVASLFHTWLENVGKRCHASAIVFVGHNIDGFDEPMLFSELLRVHAEVMPFPIFKIDTMKICKYLFPITIRSVPYGLPALFYAPESYKQADIYTFMFGVPPENTHDALGDVNALVRIMSTPLFERIISLSLPEPSRCLHA
jgi:DNA polymerase III epsilon subunit-like protein